MHKMPHTPEARAKMRASKLGKPAPWRRRQTIVVDAVTLYRCGACGRFYRYEDFPPEKHTLLGIKSACRSCHSQCSIATRDPANTRRLRRESEARRRARAND